MSWLCVDKDGTEVVCSSKPMRLRGEIWAVSMNNDEVELPNGTIKKIIGKELSWNDEPVKI